MARRDDTYCITASVVPRQSGPRGRDGHGFWLGLCTRPGLRRPERPGGGRLRSGGTQARWRARGGRAARRARCGACKARAPSAVVTAPCRPLSPLCRALSPLARQGAIRVDRGRQCRRLCRCRPLVAPLSPPIARDRGDTSPSVPRPRLARASKGTQRGARFAEHATRVRAAVDDLQPRSRHDAAKRSGAQRASTKVASQHARAPRLEAAPFRMPHIVATGWRVAFAGGHDRGSGRRGAGQCRGCSRWAS